MGNKTGRQKGSDIIQMVVDNIIKDATTSQTIAVIHGVDLTSVSRWTSRYEDFPAPVAILAGAKVYAVDEVDNWARYRKLGKYGPDNRKSPRKIIEAYLRGEIDANGLPIDNNTATDTNN